MHGYTKICCGLRNHSQGVLSLDPDPTDILAIRFVLGICPADPFCFPVLRVQQTHFPPSIFTRLRNAPSRVPNTHSPVVTLARLQCRSFVSNSNRLIRFDPPAVPNIRLARLETLTAAGH